MFIFIQNLTNRVVIPKSRLVLVLVGIGFTICLSVIHAVALVLSLEMGIALLGVTIAMMLVPFLLHRPQWLFYAFMLGLVFGQIGPQFASFPQISFSNILLAYSFALLIPRLTVDRGELRSLFGHHRKVLVIVVASLLLVQDVLSATVNHEFGFLTARLGYVLVVFVVFMLVQNRTVLLRGLILGIISVGTLSMLTILRSLNLISIGYRANWNWRVAPWEAFLPRAIGLPDMDSGLHGVLILSMLPLAAVLAAKGGELGVRRHKWLCLVVAAGVAAIMVASYRSGWIASFVCLLAFSWMYYRFVSSQKVKARVIFVSLVVLVLCILLLSQTYKEGFDYLFRVFFVARPTTQSRLMQYEHALRRTFSSAMRLMFGFGYGSFEEAYYQETANLDFAADLHNHFLGYLYSAGLPSLLLYGYLLVTAARWFLEDVMSTCSATRLLSLGLLTGLIGVLVVLNSTVRLGGYKIIWILVSISAVLPLLNESRASVCPSQ